MLKNPNFSLKIGVFLSIIIMVCGMWLIHYDIQSQTLTLLSQQNKINQFYLDDFKKIQSNVIRTLADNGEIQTYIDDNNSEAIKLLYHCLKADSQIMQIRLIGLNGDERIRFDRRRDGTLYKTPINELQNKSDRPYFKQFVSLPKNSVGFSDFDLNIEHGKIDIPFNPTLRLGIPVYKDGKKQALIVINYYMQEWITHLLQYNHSHFYLVDNEGYFLIHPDPQWAWSRYQSDKKKAPDFFHQSLEYFSPLLNEEYRWVNSNTIAFSFDLYGKKLLALYQPEVSPNEILTRRLIQFGSIILVSLLLIVAPMVRIIRLNARRIEEEKNKNERMVLHHSRLDAMGNMIAVIEHQWRQPLNSIGLIMQDLVSAFHHQELTKEYFAESQKNVMHQLQFMSQTLDTFRDFFYTQKNQHECNLLHVVHEISQLCDMQFKTLGIILEIRCKNKTGEMYPVDQEKHPEIFNLSTHSTEIKHILLNLISNAKEALNQLQISQSSKHIIITLSAENNILCIDVTDFAGGIDPSIADKIFTPYFTTKKSGTGLGLYIAKTLTEYFMQGQLSYTTDTKEGWSTFHLMIPK
ncbi:MAG: hypothetical protein CJD30_08460 [Sulfuricurvum sp. PD_MW2]|uniref:sensor histidine kinase n=1 Tax=Sulfuricurvum sp. PD_MW2 TaxID=2027917 RepID=UPI000C0642E3|nr:sensor histidine kinase [Sulfuricurvum sp. PD_MW2]PHM17028.1 MAG: hypothetical protein CJD30_08460 [Sulfuricurvum sp. PD_MW2]